MKRKVTNSIRIPLRWLCLVVVVLVHVQVALCNTSTYYYKATATPSPLTPEAAGKVYISKEGTTSPTYQAATVTVTGNTKTIADQAQTTLHLYAQANDDFLFDHWALGSANGTTVSTATSFNPEITYSSESESKPTTFNYYAVFKAQTGLIKVRSANESLGSVTISNSDNKHGDIVTLTAYPDATNGVLFEGWTKDASSPYVSTEIVSMENPLVLEANSETKGTYTAHFSNVAEKVYVRLQNKATGRFISFYGNNLQNGVAKGAVSHTRSMSGESRDDGFKFDNCWKLISETDAQGNPETVFLRAGHAGGSGVTYGADLTAHGISYSSLIHETNTNKYMLTLEKSSTGDTYRIYTEFAFTRNGKTVYMNSYFCDEGTDWLVMKTTQDLSIPSGSDEWYVYALDANTTVGAFGANTKSKYIKGEKYYTTMYADFPYKCLDGVKAYYLKHEKASYNQDLNMVFFTEVPDGKVPANMAVVLECNAVQNDFSSNKAVVNCLLPLLPTGEGVPQENSLVNESEHFLRGYVSVNGSSRDNNKETMYVLSFDKSLGFYHFNNAKMTPNKAYLDTQVALDDYPNSASVTFVFGKDNTENTNKIITHNIFVDDDDAPVFDLIGRQMVGDLPKGIYIRNGKKFVVK